MTKIYKKHAKPQMSQKVPENYYHVDHVFNLNSLQLKWAVLKFHTCSFKKKEKALLNNLQAQWHMLTIPEIQEVEARGL